VAALLAARLGGKGGETAFDESTGLLGRGIGLDSIEVMELVAAAEEMFGITVRDDELLPGEFETVGTFVSFIEARIAA
jgi:acyl carrier protein